MISDPPTRGTGNMAVDEALRESAARSGTATLRFYAWSPPTLSLGYFQRSLSRAEHLDSRSLPLVRRSSGGGAIVHDREITYSLAIPAGSRFGRQGQELVRSVHEALVESLGEWKIQAGLCQHPTKADPRDEPFLCFLRRSLDDVLIGTQKIAGSAQRRPQGSLLQHGSVLLHSSAFAGELPGICDLAACAVDAAELRNSWTRQLAHRLDLRFLPGVLTEEERLRAEWWEAHCFATARWNEKR